MLDSTMAIITTITDIAITAIATTPVYHSVPITTITAVDLTMMHLELYVLIILQVTFIFCRCIPDTQQ